MTNIEVGQAWRHVPSQNVYVATRFLGHVNLDDSGRAWWQCISMVEGVIVPVSLDDAVNRFPEQWERLS